MLERLQQSLIRLLRWSERYTKTDMVYLAHGGFWLGVSYVAQMINALILSIALANLLPKEAYGIYQFIISVATIIGGLTLSGMGTAMMRAVAQGAQGTLQYAFRKQLQWSVGIILASAGVALYYVLQHNFGLAIAFVITGLCMPLLAAFSLFRLYLEGKQQFRESTTLGSWRRPIPVIAVIVALFITHNPIAIVAVYFISQTISTGLLYWHIIRKYPEIVQDHPELLRYSKHLSFLGFIALVMNNIDDVFIFHYLGAAPVAVYSLAQLPSIQLGNLFGLVSNLIFPKFAQRDFATLRATAWHKVMVFFLLCVAASLAYVIAAPFLFHVLFPKYPDAVLLSDALMLTLLLKPFTIYNQAFAAHGRKGAQYFVQISTALLKVLLFVAFIPLWGVWGAVWASVAIAVYWGASLAIFFYATQPIR